MKHSVHQYHHHRKRRHLPLGLSGFLSFLEGVESGFAITAGILLGLSFQLSSRHLLITTACLTIIVNAVNSASVKYASEHTLDELDGREKHKVILNSLSPALVQFVTHVFVAGLILLPAIIFPLDNGIMISLLLTLVLLGWAGWYRGTTLHSHPLRDALETIFLGVLIMGTGALAGWMLSL